LTEKKFSAWLTPRISIKARKLNPTWDEVNAARSLTDKRQEVAIIKESFNEGASSVIALKPLAGACLWVEVHKENPLPLLDKSSGETDRCGRLPCPTFVIHNSDGFHQGFPFC
jgi:hypothetical protein